MTGRDAVVRMRHLRELLPYMGESALKVERGPESSFGATELVCVQEGLGLNFSTGKKKTA